MTPLRLLIVSDGRPGHFNLSEGIAAAIGRLAPTTIQRLEIRRGSWPGAVLAALTRARAPARSALQLVYGLDLNTVSSVDVIISAGAETLAANVWLARSFKVPNIFYGSHRAFSEADFTLPLTSYATGNNGRQLRTLKPSAFAPAVRSQTRRQPRNAALILGGDAGTFTYTTTDWSNLLRFTRELNAADGTRWLVSNSRRTSNQASDMFDAAASAPHSAITTFVDVRRQDAPKLTTLLPHVDVAVCTEDSSSMISECIWAGLPVIGVSPTKSSHTRKEAEYRAWLTQQNWYRSFAIADLTPELLEQTLHTIEPLDSDPAEGLAKLIAQRIPDLIG